MQNKRLKGPLQLYHIKIYTKRVTRKLQEMMMIMGMMGMMGMMEMIMRLMRGMRRRGVVGKKGLRWKGVRELR